MTKGTSLMNTMLPTACFLALVMTGAVADTRPLLPIEVHDIPVNGNEKVADPEAVKVEYGFSTRAALASRP